MIGATFGVALWAQVAGTPLGRIGGREWIYLAVLVVVGVALAFGSCPT
jgi:hypothetical protein